MVPAKLDFFATQDFNPTWGFSNFSIIIECYQDFKCDELNTLGNSRRQEIPLNTFNLMWVGRSLRELAFFQFKACNTCFLLHNKSVFSLCALCKALFWKIPTTPLSFKSSNGTLPSACLWVILGGKFPSATIVLKELSPSSILELFSTLHFFLFIQNPY